MKKRIKTLEKQVDNLHKENADDIKHLMDNVKIVDATRFSNTDDLQAAIAEQISKGYELKNTLNSLLIFVLLQQ